MNFFIVGLGRSGTMWLSALLDQAPGHRCLHEKADARSKVVPQSFSPFPAERFLEAGPHYGECHGMLRYHLSPGVPNGKEKIIPRRAWLRRNLLAVIASWMNQGHRTPAELSATCFEVLWQYQNLQQWAAQDTAVRLLDLEELTSSPAAAQHLVDWLGLPLVVTEEMLQPRNALPAKVKQFQWGEAELQVLRTVAGRLQFEGIDQQITSASALRGG